MNARAADLEASSLDDQSRDDERGGKEDVLDTGQRRHNGKDEEHRLRPRGRPLEGDDAGKDCAQRQGHAQGIGGDVGAEDNEGRATVAAAASSVSRERQSKAAAEEVDRDRRQRDREGVNALRDPVGDLGVVLQPGRLVSSGSTSAGKLAEPLGSSRCPWAIERASAE